MPAGKNSLRLPPYDGRPPVECSVRCPCGARYLVFTGTVIIGDAEGRARERAAQMNCRFVDARVEPFLLCECGQALDFSTALETSAVM